MKWQFLFHSRYISRHFIVDVIWRLPVWNGKIRRYLASCMLQFGSNLTKTIFQGKHFNYFIVVGGWRHVFWSDTHYSISLRYTRNIVQLNSFYIKFDLKHFFFIYIINTITNWRMIITKYFVGGGLWRLLNINLFITSARPLKSIFSLFRLYIWDHYIHNLYISWFISSNEMHP